jgi:hypothetical protein
MINDFHILECYENALTGKGAANLSWESFRHLSNYIQDRNVIIADVEVYERNGEAEFIRTDLSIWPANGASLDWEQKLEGMKAEISRFFLEIKDQGGDFYFNVWLDDNT